MATIPERLHGQVTLEVDCFDRLYLNGYIGRLATVLGQMSEKVPSISGGDDIASLSKTTGDLAAGSVRGHVHG